MIKIIDGNILDVTKGVIVSMVNCQNKMGRGLAKSIYEKWPAVKSEYHAFCLGAAALKTKPLGLCHSVEVEPGLFVCNVFGQEFYGPGDKCYVSYEAVESGFKILSDAISFARDIREQGPVYFPYLFGCGLAGGDWKVMSELIEKYFPDAIIVRLAPEKAAKIDAVWGKQK